MYRATSPIITFFPSCLPPILERGLAQEVAFTSLDGGMVVFFLSLLPCTLSSPYVCRLGVDVLERYLGVGRGGKGGLASASAPEAKQTTLGGLPRPKDDDFIDVDYRIVHLCSAY